MHLKTKSGRRVILPTPEEDAALTAAAADDPDNPVLSDDEWDEARLRAVRPEPDTGKERVAVRLSEQVVQRFVPRVPAGKGAWTRPCKIG
jgi:hypothetical protein